MGFIRKITGTQAQIDAGDRNAAAQEAATKQAAASEAAALQTQARAAADQQSLMSARMAAEDQAREAANRPLDTADVQLRGDSTETVSTARRKKRAQFGRSYSSGVSL